MAHSVFGSEMKTLFGNDVFNLALEQLQSDEESTDTEAGEVEKSIKLKVIRPSWRSRKVDSYIHEYCLDINTNYYLF